MLRCMSGCTFHFCLHGCVCAHMCALYDGGGGRAGIRHRLDQHQSDWEDPSCSHDHTCKPRLPQKIGQWSTTHARTRKNTHTLQTAVSTQENHSLPFAHCRRSATQVQHSHTHLPAAETRPLGWNNRIKNRPERSRDRSPAIPPRATPKLQRRGKKEDGRKKLLF